MKKFLKISILIFLTIQIFSIKIVNAQTQNQIGIPIAAMASENTGSNIIEIQGIVTYNDLEGGFYQVGGYRLSGDFEFDTYYGKNVKITGIKSSSVSIYMTKAIEVQSIEIVDDIKVEDSLTSSLDSSIAQIQYIKDNMENFTKQYGEDSSEVRNYEKEMEMLKNDAISLLEQIILMDGQSIDIDRYKQLGDLIGDKEEEINIYINGRKPIFEQNVLPFIENGRTLVPFRVIAENMGAEVLWDAEKKSVTVKKDEIDILLFIGLRIAYVNGEAYSLDVPAKIINDRTVVPLRFIAETLEGEVKWIPSGRIVAISYDDKVIEPISVERDFKVSYLKDAFGLGAWDNKINLEEILGEILSEEIKQLDESAGILTGSCIKTQKYFGIELGLMSPGDNGKTFFINKISITGKDYITARGIKVGDSYTKIIENYNYEVQDNSKYDERNHTYDIRDKSGVYSIAFEVEYGTVKSISLRILQP